MIRAQMPLIGISPCLAIAAEKNLAASFAVKQFQNPRPTGARQCGAVMKPSNGARSCSVRYGIAMRIRAHPQTLQVSEKQVCPHRQYGTPFPCTSLAESREQSLCTIESSGFR